MIGSSARHMVIRSILLIAMMGFLTGICFLSGLGNVMRGKWEYLLQIALIPFLIFVIVLHARVILRQLGTRSGESESAS